MAASVRAGLGLAWLVLAGLKLAAPRLVETSVGLILSTVAMVVELLLGILLMLSVRYPACAAHAIAASIVWAFALFTVNLLPPTYLVQALGNCGCVGKIATTSAQRQLISGLFFFMGVFATTMNGNTTRRNAHA